MRNINSPLRFEVDLHALHAALTHRPALSGAEVLGPQEWAFGGVRHEYRRIDAGALLHIQKYRILRPGEYRVIRGDYVSFQFVIGGAYAITTEAHAHVTHPATVRIIGYRESIARSSPGQELSGLSIAVERDQLVRSLGLKVDNLPKAYRSIFASAGAPPLALELPLSPNSWIGVEQILRCDLAEPLRTIYLNAKAAELLCDTISALNQFSVRSLNAQQSAALRDRNLIETAASIYRRELSQPPSIGEMSVRLGVNRNKLLRGFRDAFGQTPNDYSIAQRLDWARVRLNAADIPVSQIANAAGYANHSAFSRAFNRHFGFPPSRTPGRRLPSGNNA